MAAIALTAVIGLGHASCSPGRPDADLPPPPNELFVRATEYGFALEPAAAPVPFPSRVVVRFVNEGTSAHSLTIVALPEDFPPLAEQARSASGLGAATLARIPQRPGGGSGTVAVDLRPGRYGFLCFVRDSDGLVHAAKGMAVEIRVPEAPEPAPVSAPSLTTVL